jgi:hypothetical protein
VTATTPCQCTHLALDHHLSGYRGCKGAEGRGRCAMPGCPCRSYALIVPTEVGRGVVPTP